MMADSTLFKRLSAKHPDYAAWEPEWLRYRDVVGDALVDKERYLPRNKFEPVTQYDFRVELSQFVPESGLAIDRLLGALYKEKPKRDLAGHAPELKGFMDRATRKGQSFNQIIEDISHRMMSYGTTRVLVNVPPVNLPDNATPLTSDGGLTRAEEQRAGLRPSIIDYSPFAVLDWEHDIDGVISYCRIKEERTVRLPSELESDKTHGKFVRFLEYDRETVTWTDFQETKDSEMEQVGTIETRTHGLGVVPLVVENLREVKEFIGHSFIRYGSRADIRKFQAESDLAYDTYMHAHPFLAIWTEDELKEVGVGSSTFLKLNPGTGSQGREDARYVESPANAFEALQQVIEENRTLIYRQAQVDPLGQISSGKSTQNFQASGVSRAWSFGTSEARVLGKVADRMESLERQILEIVLRFLDPDARAKPPGEVFEGNIQYPEDYDLSSTHQLIEERALIATQVNSPSLLKIIDKRIAASKVGESTAAELKKIVGEIENNPLLGTMAGKTGDPFAMPTGREDESRVSGGSNVSGRKQSAASNPGSQSTRRTKSSAQ